MDREHEDDTAFNHRRDTASTRIGVFSSHLFSPFNMKPSYSYGPIDSCSKVSVILHISYIILNESCQPTHQPHHHLHNPHMSNAILNIEDLSPLA